MLKESRVWVLVADGSRARILKNFGHSTDEAIEEFDAPNLALGEIMADQAGRSFASVGGRRSAMELKSDPVRENEKAFASVLADTLEKHRRRGIIDALLVIAAPRTLGDLRNALSPQLNEKVVLESNKDLTGMPDNTLREAIVKLRKSQSAAH